MVRHHRLLYADLSDPVATLRSKGGGALSGHWPYAEGRRGEPSAYSALMAASQPMIARQVLDAYPFHKHRHVMDVGGGSGAFLHTLDARVPGLELTVFDLPEVTALAGVGRAKRTGGSFKDSLPQGADLITLIRILHDHDDATVLDLLRTVHDALPPGGSILVAEPMADTPGVNSYFEIYLWAMGSGRPRTPGELRQMLGKAGFVSIRRRHAALPLATQILSAIRKV
jgi:demethylspheroidene O-methyltransferase